MDILFSGIRSGNLHGPLIKTCPMAQETFFESSWPRKQPPKQRPRSKPPLGESSQKLAVPQFPDSVHAPGLEDALKFAQTLRLPFANLKTAEPQ